MEIFNVPELRHEPFEHLIWNEALQAGIAEQAWRQLCDEAIPWRLHREHFFEQWEVDLLSLPPGRSVLAGRDVTDAVLARAAELYGENFAPTITLSAHRLCPGQGIGLHNDFLGSGGETHRFVLHMGGYNRGGGGELLLFGSKDPSDIRRIYQPLHNSAVSFRIGPGTYHAVADVRAEQRYSVVWSLFSISS